MIVVKLIGGLGNQMFQYAAGRALAEKRNTKLFLDLSAFREYKLRKYELGAFNIRANSAGLFSRLKLKTGLAGSVFSEQTQFEYDQDFELQNDNCYLDGYFQNPMYFEAIASQLLEEFTLQSPPASSVGKIVARIRETESVSLHVRRGDYVTNPKVKEILPLCTKEYYLNAVEIIHSQLDDPTFFLFSDDVEWVRAELQLPYPCEVVSTDDHHHDLVCMSACRHHIIANSSFSWWGAWLNPRADKLVVGPEPWAIVDGRAVSPMPCDWTRVNR